MILAGRGYHMRRSAVQACEERASGGRSSLEQRLLTEVELITYILSSTTNQIIALNLLLILELYS